MSAGGPALFGVLDCAVDDGLYAHVKRLGPGYARCLFRDGLHPEVVAVSPHLIELRPDDLLTLAWTTEGRGRNWGVLIRSRAGFHAVWSRLRRFTQAKLPDGEGPVLFRFWDPRVFRVWAPVLEPDQVPEWFRDIDAWEAEDGSGLIRYTANGAGVSATAVPFASA